MAGVGVVIVGGGIAGLSAAYDLAKAGTPYTLFEKLPRLGGVIETTARDGCIIEGGPDSFISQKPEALALIKELGLEQEVIGSNDATRVTYILHHGRLVRLPEGIPMIVPTRVRPMVKSPLLGWGTKLRMGLELFRRPASNPDRSVADFVIDHFGQETLDYLAEPLLSGVYGGDPREMSVDSVLGRVRRDGEEIREPGARGAEEPRAPPRGRRHAIPDAEGRTGHVDREAGREGSRCGTARWKRSSAAGTGSAFA